MSLAKFFSTAPLQVQLLREGIPESVHFGQATVCDSRGRVLMAAGPSESETFIRSALKPFQALAVTTTGTLDKFELSDRDLAIMCGSHTGAVAQSRQAFNILWQANLEPALLQCPIPEGKHSPLEHNCSGKHAGMLAVCQRFAWPLHDYMDRRHPVQQLVLAKVAECLGMPVDEFIGARDDCGVPTYLLQLRQMATLYAQLASGDRLDLERIVRAMTQHPSLIAGPGSFDTMLMELSEGRVVSKSGAEGVQCVGLVGQGMGLAIKVQDGARRAKYAIAVHLLRQMGWISPDIAEVLDEAFVKLDAYKRLDITGELAIV
jgi:L-asparaginase